MAVPFELKIKPPVVMAPSSILNVIARLRVGSIITGYATSLKNPFTLVFLSTTLDTFPVHVSV